MYVQNAKIRRVRVTIFAVENNEYYSFRMCVCSLSYRTCVIYCQLRSAWLYHVFPHYLTNGKILVKQVTEHKMDLIYCTTSVSNIWLSRRTGLDIIINVCTYIFTRSTRCSCQIFIKTVFSR
jgi:hypothetical protein